MTTGRKIVLSAIVTVVFFVVLEGVLALVGVKTRNYSADPYVGFSSTSLLFVEDGTGFLETNEDKATLFNSQRFPADKGDAFRVFCVGGSTTFGRPYDDVTSFCGWLRELLPVADPTRRFEVINAGGVSYASYRVALLMEELIEYDPDLFIVYSGHNEFLERRTYPQIIATPRVVRGLGSVAARTRTWTAVSALVETVRGPAAGPESDPDILGAEVKTLLDGAVGPGAYSRDDELADGVIQHYRFNLGRMSEIAASVGAETVFVTPAGNLKDSRPFKSEHRGDLGDTEKRRFDELVEGARTARGRGRTDLSLEQINQAATIDPRHAQLAYLQGRLLAEAGRWEEARRAFERARDEDICPLRALGPMPTVVREVAAERRAVLVDFAALADDWAEHGIPGSGLFLDHVHPTIEVHRKLAVSIIKELERSGLVSFGPGWGPDVVAEAAERVESGLDAQTHALALMKLSKVLGWAGKLDESARLGQQAVQLYPEDSRIQYNAGVTAHLVGRKDVALVHYRRAVEIQPDADEPHGNLGVLLEEAGRVDEAILHYRLAIRYARTPETETRNRANLANALMVSGYRDYSQGRRAEALVKLDEAAELAPSDPEILGRLGIAQLADGQPAKAVASFSTALRARPNDPVLTNRLALALALDGKPDRAAHTYARALELDPAVIDLPDNLFRILGNLGREDLANEIRDRLGG